MITGAAGTPGRRWNRHTGRKFNYSSFATSVRAVQPTRTLQVHFDLDQMFFTPHFLLFPCGIKMETKSSAARTDDLAIVSIYISGGSDMLDKSNRKWKDIVTGKLELKTDNFGLQMFLKRAVTRFSSAQDPGELEKTVAELHGFFVKYERVLAKEIAIISK